MREVDLTESEIGEYEVLCRSSNLTHVQFERKCELWARARASVLRHRAARELEARRKLKRTIFS